MSRNEHAADPFGLGVAAAGVDVGGGTDTSPAADSLAGLLDAGTASLAKVRVVGLPLRARSSLFDFLVKRDEAVAEVKKVFRSIVNPGETQSTEVGRVVVALEPDSDDELIVMVPGNKIETFEDRLATIEGNGRFIVEGLANATRSESGDVIWNAWEPNRTGGLRHVMKSEFPYEPSRDAFERVLKSL